MLRQDTSHRQLSIVPYLATTDNGTLYTPGTFLAYRLRGKAKKYRAGYLGALRRSLSHCGAVPVRSIKGGTAFISKQEGQ